MDNNDSILISNIFSPNGETITAQDISVKKKPVHLLISLEATSFQELRDTLYNSNWKVESLTDFTKYQTILDKYNKFDIKTIALIHHGNRYCPRNLAGGRKLVWSTDFYTSANFAEMDNNIIDKSTNATDLEYANLLIEEFKTRFVYDENDETLNSFFILYVCLKRLIASITEGGNYISIACDEADNLDFLPLMGGFSDNNIKLYANREKTTIGISNSYTYGNLKVENFGSIMNMPLTTWVRGVSLGWVYYDSATRTLTNTGKDLVLNCIGQPFSLIQGGSVPKNKISLRQQYYSKKFKDWYISNWKLAAYEQWKLGVKPNI